MLGEVPRRRLALIEKIVAAGRGSRIAGRRALAARLLRAYWRGVAEEDLAARSPDYLARVALHHLALARRRAPGRATAIVRDPREDDVGIDSPHTLAFVVTDDMPFLVDTVGMVFAQAGAAVHFIAHPVLAVQRDARGRLLDVALAAPAGERGWRSESWQLVEIDRQVEPARARELEARLAAALADVRAAVTDWHAMRTRLREAARGLEGAPVPAQEITEARALLEWMDGGHFTFLGYRHYALRRGEAHDTIRPDVPSGLGILRVPRAGVPPPRPVRVTGRIRRRARVREALIVTKANAIATVHRSTYLDYVGVKTYDARGDVDGEHRFLGLWTSGAYHLAPAQIPVLRRKVQQVVQRFGLPASSHDAKAVQHVLDTYPRDELFQAEVPELVDIVRGIVNLYERRQVRIFLRRDPFGRFYSCLVYVPRDRYNTTVRQRIEGILTRALDGAAIETQVEISGSTLARLHALVKTRAANGTAPDVAAIEREIAAAATTWGDRLRAILPAHHDETTALALARRYADAFPPGYEAQVDPVDALEDIADLEALRTDAPGTLRLNLHRPAWQVPGRVHLKILKRGDPVPISDLLPTLENFGLRVIAERPHELRTADDGASWIQDFELEPRDGGEIDIASVEPSFVDALLATWRGSAENDGFARLLLGAGLQWQQIAVLRAYSRYLLQTGLPFSQASMERALAAHTGIARDLQRLFEARLDPALPASRREAAAARIERAIRDALDRVSSPDEDRIVRAFLATIGATLRTNYWQRDADGMPKPSLALKLDPARVPDLPRPRPRHEIFVYSPRVEGVHMRMGDVARGGIRWSDRREDFRTEILGLMKAQNVKNALIVPVGAKGGFFPKRLPPGPRDAVQREAIECYRTFIRGLLDLTDNIVGGRVVPPARTVRHDGDDTYLVVAADKGTASFSDVANGIAADYGYWLGDAFASGGSAGFDHKKMGITARGAWECVKRHFRELGVDIQSQAFTVAGIGDMSGDVFGNGMLLSRHIRLQAAFNHAHVFLDPAPDAAASFAERERLFRLPRSGWDDYDLRTVSRGGGVWSRGAKSIPLAPEARTMLGIAAASATPQEVIRAILRMPVDLLWNGGIGTYVKASDESHGAVGDRANDAVRVDGRELRARVVGEGGNLGFSQRGRVEYARAGGRIDTDFIDNSGGVNTSDVEVNLKILLNPLVREKRLALRARDRLLASMGTDVARLVLRNNYLQGQALSVLELQAAQRLGEFQQLVRSLERTGDLDRALEFLPDDEEFAARAEAGKGLTRPELAVLLCYGKLWLDRHLLDSDVPEDPYLSRELERYFPAPVRRRFAGSIAHHRLRREIIATAITNSLVNRMGPTFVQRAQDETGADPARIARAYAAAREIFAMRALWAQVEQLDGRLPAALQYSMHARSAQLLVRTTYWLLEHRRRGLQVDRAVAEFRDGVHELGSAAPRCLAGADAARFEATLHEHVAAGVPQALARQVAALLPLECGLDIVDLANRHRLRPGDAACTWFALGARTGLDWMRERIETLPADGAWQAIARAGLRDSALRTQRRLAEGVLGRSRRGPAGSRVEAWAARASSELQRWDGLLRDMRAAATVDFATLTVGLEAVRRLAD